MIGRRGFLKAFGTAAIGAAALQLDPDQLLWVPGRKTIVDFGATKHLVPATDAEMLAFARDFLEPAIVSFGADVNNNLGRHIKIEVMGDDGRLITTRYQGDTLISTHTAEELAVLNRPFAFSPDLKPRGWIR